MPEFVAEDPTDEGWLIRMKVSADSIEAVEESADDEADSGDSDLESLDSEEEE